MGFLRDFAEGMTASVQSWTSVLHRLFASWPLSAIRRRGAVILDSNAGAVDMSAVLPGVSEKAAILPQISVNAWIFVVGPPLERPMA